MRGSPSIANVRPRHTGLLALCFLIAGCGSSTDAGNAPIACTTSAGSYLTALRSAPKAVLLDQQTPISECLVSNQAAGERADIGQTFVAVASELNGRARNDPGGSAATELGYLLGAVEQSSSTTGGIHQDLVRRLEAAANFDPEGNGLGARFENAYDAGFAAGQETG